MEDQPATALPALPPGAALASLKEVKAWLLATDEPEDVQQLRDQAEAISVVSRRRQDSHELALAASEAKVRAERRIGQLLPPTSQGRRSDLGSTSCTYNKLATATNLSLWRKIAGLSDPLFEAQLLAWRESETLAATSPLVALARQVQAGKLDPETGEPTPSPPTSPPGGSGPPAAPPAETAPESPGVTAPSPVPLTADEREHHYRELLWELWPRGDDDEDEWEEPTDRDGRRWRDAMRALRNYESDRAIGYRHRLLARLCHAWLEANFQMGVGSDHEKLTEAGIAQAEQVERLLRQALERVLKSQDWDHPAVATFARGCNA